MTRSRIAGTWYPDERVELERLVEDCVSSAPHASVDGHIVGLVVPHAGLRYSGSIAAAAYRLLDASLVDGVLVLGPRHRGGPGLEVLVGESIETPFGAIEMDRALEWEIAEFGSLVAATHNHGDEHSVEVQFPFLQRFLPGVPVTAVLMGFQTPAVIARTAEWLEAVVARSGRRMLLVGSSDLSHYESRGAARALDERVLRRVETLDPDGLGRLLVSNPRHACGGGPIVSVMTAARALGATRGSILAYGDSGDVTGDTSSVVGYLSAAFLAGA